LIASISASDNSARRARIIAALLIVLYVAARLWKLTDACLWFDELFSIHAARHGWAGLLAFVSADLIHPPLFYLLLKIWIVIGGESLWWLRLFPVLLSCAALVPFFLLCRVLRLNSAEINFALLLLAVNGYLIHYAQVIRMYSLLVLLTLCSLWLFARLCHIEEASWRSWLSLWAVNLLLIYTHYFGWLVILAELFYLLARRRRKLIPFCKLIGVLFLCYVPWALTVARAATQSAGLAQNIGWMPRPDLDALARYFVQLHEPLLFREAAGLRGARLVFWLLFYFILFGCPILLWAARSLKARAAKETSDDKLLFLLTFSLLPLVGVFALSYLLPHSIWGARHLLIVAVPYLILLAVALRRLRPLWLSHVILIIFVCWTLLAGESQVLKKEPHFIWCAWDELIARFVNAEAAAPRGTKIYAFEDLTAYHLWFALDTLHEKRFQVALVKDIPGLIEDPAYFLPRGFAEISFSNSPAINEESFWLAFRDTAWNPERQPLKTFTERGYQVEERLQIEAHGYTAFLVRLRRRH